MLLIVQGYIRNRHVQTPFCPLLRCICGVYAHLGVVVLLTMA